MSNKIILSILGMYNYDPSVFQNLELPDDINFQEVIDNILLDNAQLSLVYTDLDFMKYAIGIWSRSELDIWDRLNKAFNEEYNPLWNVDENTTETREIDRDKTSSNSGSGSGTENNSGTQNTSGSYTDNDTTTKSIKGFNSESWADHEKVVDAKTGSNQEGVTSQNSGTTSNSYSDTGSENEDITETFTRRRGGNIGVTMSQQLLEAELNVRPKMNIYKYISNSFKNRFCNMIY